MYARRRLTLRGAMRAQVTARPEAFERCRVPDRYLELADGGRSRAATFRLQVRAS
jgi:hypothetical protein